MPTLKIKRRRGLPKVCLVTGDTELVAFHRVNFVWPGGHAVSWDREPDGSDLTRAELGRAAETVAVNLVTMPLGVMVKSKKTEVITLSLPFSNDAWRDWLAGDHCVSIVDATDSDVELSLPCFALQDAKDADLKQRLRDKAAASAEERERRGGAQPKKGPRPKSRVGPLDIALYAVVIAVGAVIYYWLSKNLY